MTINFKRAASIGSVGAALLFAMGCSADANPTQSEQVGEETQAFDGYYYDCVNSCESDYNDAYYKCQIGGNDWICFGYAQVNVEMCLSFCPSWFDDPPGGSSGCSDPNWLPAPPTPPGPAEPGCDRPRLMACYYQCDLCVSDWIEHGLCIDACHDRFCAGFPGELPPTTQPPNQPPTEPPNQPPGPALTCGDRVGIVCDNECQWMVDSDYWSCQGACLDRLCGTECRQQSSTYCAIQCEGHSDYVDCQLRCLDQTCG